MEKTTLLIADDSKEMRETLKTLLGFNESIEVVGEAADGIEAVEKVKELKPDIVLMDINMPQMDGIKATEIINLETPFTAVIVISVQEEIEYMRRSMMAGARDYLVKPFSSDELFHTIQAVIEKEKAKEHTQRRLPGAAAPAGGADGKVICVFSTKGGVGKSITATNLAFALKEATDSRVLILDLNLQFGDQALLMNLSPANSIFELAQVGDSVDLSSLQRTVESHPSGVDLLPSPPKPEFAELITSQLIEDLIRIAKTQWDYIVIDTSPTFQEYILAAMDSSDNVLVMVTPDFLSLKNVWLGLSVMYNLNYEDSKICLVLNRSPLATALKSADIEKHLKKKIFAELPFDSKVVISSVNKGNPFILSEPKSEISNAVRSLAKKMIDMYGDEAEVETEATAGKKKILGGLFGGRR
jgi:pilus assembly protein CpaE